MELGKTKVLKGHTNGVWSVFVKDNVIISGSSDETIKIQDINTGVCLKMLEGYVKCVWYVFQCVNSIFVKDNLIISGSLDKTI